MKSKIEQSKKTKIATSSTAEQLRQSSDEEGFTNICLKRQKAEVIFSISFLFTSLICIITIEFGLHHCASAAAQAIVKA